MELGHPPFRPYWCVSRPGWQMAPSPLRLQTLFPKVVCYNFPTDFHSHSTLTYQTADLCKNITIQYANNHTRSYYMRSRYVSEVWFPYRPAPWKHKTLQLNHPSEKSVELVLWVLYREPTIRSNGYFEGYTSAPMLIWKFCMAWNLWIPGYLGYEQVYMETRQHDAWIN